MRSHEENNTDKTAMAIGNIQLSLSPLKHRFIPFRKRDVVEMCLVEDHLDAADKAKFRQLCMLVLSSLHFEFHERLEFLKDVYAPVNPDRDTVVLEELSTGQPPSGDGFNTQLADLLNLANYDKFSDVALQSALNETSLFNLKLHIDFSVFDEVNFYTRGESVKREVITKFFGLYKKEIEFINYERVVIYSQFGSDYKGKHPAGVALLKLFQNVPRADIEMLFPNTKLGMRLIDKLMIIVPALIGGGLLLKTKAGQTLLELISNPGLWLGFEAEKIELNQTALLGVSAALGALGSFVWKQFTNFKHRKLRFMQTLSDNLYLKNLDNNAGVFHKLIDEAEEEECKEVVLAYYFLLTHPELQLAADLDSKIECWLKDRWQVDIDFEISDALRKLVKLGLIADSEELKAEFLDQALSNLDQRWDAFFDFPSRER